MIFYVNGDSHTAAAEAVNYCAFAEDDDRYNYLKRRPHPENLESSWGRVLSHYIKSAFQCDAESASSNDRILRTTREWIQKHPNTELVIIQWSTWERQEWLIDGIWYQVNGSGIDQVPADHELRYKEFIANIDWQICTEKWHKEIWQLHLELSDLKIPHVFFNGNNHFESIRIRRDWGSSYLEPYSAEQTYDSILKRSGFTTVSPKSWHFGKEAHAFWANFMLQYIVQNKII